LENSTKVILIAHPDSFRLDEAKSPVESLPHYKIVKVFTQKYLDHSKYGIGAGKAEEIKSSRRTLNHTKEYL
jgi:GTP-binding protein HflX